MYIRNGARVNFTEGQIYIQDGGDGWIPLGHAKMCMSYEQIANLSPDMSFEMITHDWELGYSCEIKVVKPPINVLQNRMYRLARRSEGRDKRWLRRQRRRWT